LLELLLQPPQTTAAPSAAPIQSLLPVLCIAYSLFEVDVTPACGAKKATG
jgi:hypothetical protein